MTDDLASTYYPWDPESDPFASTRDATTLATETHRYPLDGASDILRNVSDAERQNATLKKLQIAQNPKDADHGSDLVVQPNSQSVNRTLR